MLSRFSWIAELLISHCLLLLYSVYSVGVRCLIDFATFGCQPDGSATPEHGLLLQLMSADGIISDNRTCNDQALNLYPYYDGCSGKLQ